MALMPDSNNIKLYKQIYDLLNNALCKCLYPPSIINNFENINDNIMAKTARLTDKDQVTAHIQKLDPANAEIIEAIRQIILSIDGEIGERIKWNNPSFYYTGEMKSFDPKEYKREIAVFNLYKGRIMLVFPSGAKVNDTSGLMEGDYKDGRRTVMFKDMNDFKSKEKKLQHVIREWLKLVER